MSTEERPVTELANSHGVSKVSTASGLADDARTALADAIYAAPYAIALTTDKDKVSYLHYWGEVADSLVSLLADEGWTLTLTREGW